MRYIKLIFLIYYLELKYYYFITCLSLILNACINIYIPIYSYYIEAILVQKVNYISILFIILNILMIERHYLILYFFYFILK